MFASIKCATIKKSRGKERATVPGNNMLSNVQIDAVTRDAQRLRIQRWSMGLGTYGLNVIAVFILQSIELDSMPRAAFYMLIALAVVGNLTFYAILRSGFNLRFEDPSLTLMQIVFSYLWGILPLYYLPNVRMIIVLAMLPSFCFGMLRLDIVGHLKIAATFAAVYIGVLCVEYRQDRPGFDLTIELFQLGLVLMIVAWFTLFGSFMSNMRYRMRRQRQEIERINDDLHREIESRKATQSALELALSRVKRLTGFIPICANCKRVRLESDDWDPIESYLEQHSGASLSHCICPQCAEKLYPDL